MINDADLLPSQGSQYSPGADFIVLEILQVIASRLQPRVGIACSQSLQFS